MALEECDPIEKKGIYILCRAQIWLIQAVADANDQLDQKIEVHVLSAQYDVKGAQYDAKGKD